MSLATPLQGAPENQVPDYIKEDVFAVFEKKHLKESKTSFRDDPWISFSLELEKLEEYVRVKFNYQLTFSQMMLLIMEWLKAKRESKLEK